jgi:hypothetical protein
LQYKTDVAIQLCVIRRQISTREASKNFDRRSARDKGFKAADDILRVGAAK